MMNRLFWAVALFATLSACGSKTADQSAPIELTKAEFLTRVANYEASPTEFRYLGDKPAIIDFYASWCGPCKVVAPILEELAAEYGDRIVVYKVNVDNESDLAVAFGIRSLPTFLFVPVVGTPEMAVGGLSEAQFRVAIDKLLK